MSTIGQTIQPATPFKRIVPALVVSNAAATIAIIPPIIILLTLKLTSIAPNNVAGALAMVTGIGAFVAMIFNPVAGAIGDRTRFQFGRRRTWILAGAIFGGASLLGIGLVAEVWQITLLWALAQASFTFQLLANNALIAEQIVESRRGSISGIVGAVPGIAPLIGIALLNKMNAQPDLLKWAILAIIAVIGAVIAVILIREGRYLDSRKVKNETTKFNLWNIIPNPRKYPAFASAWVTRFLVFSCIPASLFNSVYLIERFRFSKAELTDKIMLTIVISTVLVFVFSLIGGMISDRLRRQKPFVIGAGILMGFSLILQGFAPSFPIFLVATVLMGIGSGTYFAVDLAILTRVLPNKGDAAKDLGIFNIANTLPQTIIPAIAPLILNVGGYEMFFSFTGILGMLSGIAVLGVPEMLPRESNVVLPKSVKKNN
ncbi:MFS transporter [Bacillus canaveralius]|uniref:MFS transporter n=1 Tax=Bacillus canaveralius TaxID=1403243 RepID=A0A2N5GKY7_9BACI|nr:MFS transporter [Bacillus canaveralius]PLR82184.1 MFS transporter [Bacillus canaveralius]PLR97910.1 MFS transporter [Bacillus canaveralius]